MLLKVTALPGDGIGPEVVREAVRVLEWIAATFHHDIALTTHKIGGAALVSHGDPFPRETLQACISSTAVLLGAVGGPSFDGYPAHLRPEAGLLRLRREMGAFANLRPTVCFPALEETSPMRPDVVRGADILMVRELLGGIYFGEPRLVQGRAGERTATDTMRYGEPEIERVAHVAFRLAAQRRQKVTSIDKANVLECSRLWRDVVTRVAHSYPGVSLQHMYVDSAAMSLVTRPRDFDVLLTENMFGDILSDQAGGLVGSLGVLPSASVGGPVEIYEPVHGSAPDIAGQDIANPIGAILSVAMMLRHRFSLGVEAASVEDAVAATLAAGYRTRDLAKGGQATVSTTEMGSRILEALGRGAAPARTAAG